MLPHRRFPEISLLEKLTKKQRLLLAAEIAVIFLVLVSAGIIYDQNLSQDSAEINNSPSALATEPPGLTPTSADAETPDRPESETQAIAVLTPTPDLARTSAGAETLKVQYIEREEIFETVKIPEDEDFDYDLFDFYRVGTFKSGKYMDWDLILVFQIRYGACKSRRCHEPFHLRYALKDGQAVLLPKISLPYAVRDALDPDYPNSNNPFGKFGITLAIDSDFTIPAFEYVEEITGDQPGQVLALAGFSADGELDPTRLTRVFEHSILGTVYMSRPELAPSVSFYQGYGLGTVPDDPSLGGCIGTNCFVTNAFFIFRPDGTFSTYRYQPDFSETDVQWHDGITSESEYIYYTVNGCDREQYDHISVVSPELVSDDELASIGKVRTTGDVIYGLRDSNNPLLTDFYEIHSVKILEWYGELLWFEIEIRSYSEFMASRPLFLWRDPFGRLVRFNNTDFLPPWLCEPIIYLYPEERQQVNLQIESSVTITLSTPAYQEGWSVVAITSGELLNISDDRAYPYLFWEGWSYIFPLQERGFVVKQSEVEEFLNEILPKLGLNQKETADFLEAWLPYFSDSPYYFITFIHQEIIEKIAPLEISPKPDTIIRILMDYKPLEKPAVVPPLELQAPPQRKGFTVVEWGGLRR